MSQPSPSSQPQPSFLCIEDDGVGAKCERQCAECREVQEREANGFPPEDDEEDTNVEDSYAR